MHMFGWESGLLISFSGCFLRFGAAMPNFGCSRFHHVAQWLSTFRFKSLELSSSSGARFSAVARSWEISILGLGFLSNNVSIIVWAVSDLVKSELLSYFCHNYNAGIRYRSIPKKTLPVEKLRLWMVSVLARFRTVSADSWPLGRC